MIRLLTFLTILIVLPHTAFARDYIRIVGSSSVYPFMTMAAEEFGSSTDFRTPVVEATGTGGGIKLFCEGNGDHFPDIVNASRPMKEREYKLCDAHKVGPILELKIGYDGIVFAYTADNVPYNFTLEDLFNGLALEVPNGDKLVKNPYKTWKDVRKDLPDVPIAVYGPPPTSGTRDAFVELAIEPVCTAKKAFKKAYPDIAQRKQICRILREDHHYIEAGENDNLIIQKLIHNKDAFGIFSYSFLKQNPDVIQGATINHIGPSFNTIANDSYPISRPLYIYVKEAQFKTTEGLREFVESIFNDTTMGSEGYFALKGLVPLQKKELEESIAAIHRAP